MGFRKVKLEDYGITYINVDSTGQPLAQPWLHFDPSFVRRSYPKVKSYLERNSRAYGRISSRNQKLIEAHTSAESSPARGVAIKDNAVRDPAVWFSYLNDLHIKHYGDVIDLIAEKTPLPCSKSRHKLVAAAHETFQWRKMGVYGPTKPGALRDAQLEYLQIAEANHKIPFTAQEIDVMSRAIDMVYENDYADIPKGSLKPVELHAAIVGANIHGTAGGVIQASRDMFIGGDFRYVLKKEADAYARQYHVSLSTAMLKVRQVNKYEHSSKELYEFWVDDEELLLHKRELERQYGVRLELRMPYYEAIFKIATQGDISFDPELNLITNFVRTQTGGLSVKDDVKYTLDFIRNFQFSWDSLAKAKTRMIMAQDPIFMLPSAQIIQAVDNAYREFKVSFRAGLYDPITNYELLQEQYRVAHVNGTTLAPLDFKLHDAWLHVDWMINECDRIYRPLFGPQDQWMIDYMILSFCYKTYMIPSFSGDHMDLKFGFGGLDSGHPSTNNIGSNGTRAVAALNAERSPEAFCFHKKVGANKGDDYLGEVRKDFVRSFGCDELVALANANAQIARYHFNQSKLFMVSFEDGSLVGHWDQRAHYYDEERDKLMIVASALRYGSRVYSCERVGSRVTPEEGICDQVSVLNNIVSYIGDDSNSNHCFTIEALGLDVLGKYVENDPVLLSYISKNPKSFMKSITRKILGRMSVDDYLKRRGVSPFDQEATRKMVCGDYSFTPVVWLISKGSEWLHSTADKYVGGTIEFHVNAQHDVVIDFVNGEEVAKSKVHSVNSEEEIA